MEGRSGHKAVNQGEPDKPVCIRRHVYVPLPVKYTCWWNNRNCLSPKKPWTILFAVAVAVTTGTLRKYIPYLGARRRLEIELWPME
jgi:hypothetical protein